MNSNSLSLDPTTDDLSLYNSRLALADPATSIASIVTISCRGELKEMPLIGGEATRQLGSPHARLWLTRLRKNLTAVGLRVDNLSLDHDGSINLSVQGGSKN